MNDVHYRHFVRQTPGIYQVSYLLCYALSWGQMETTDPAAVTCAECRRVLNADAVV